MTLKVFRTPPFRATSTLTTSPGLRNPITCWSWPTRSTGLPSTEMMTSPGRIPAALAGESSRGDVLDHDAADLRQADVGGIVEGHVVDGDTQRGTMDRAGLDQLVHDGAGQIDRDGEAIAGVEAGLAGDGGVDPDDLAPDAHQRAHPNCPD